MGIARGCARLLLNEYKKKEFSGSVLQLGRQTFYFSMEDLQQWAKLHDVPLRDIPSSLPNMGNAVIDDMSFFSALGFSSIQSCDVSDYEGCTYMLDLNLPVPESLHSRYDLIYDGGTMEHIFNLPMVLKNIHLMLKPGGRIIHASPSTNHVDHGFFMFSPTLFHDYYSLNRYRIDTSYIVTYTPQYIVDPWQIFYYEPGSLDEFACGGFDKGFMLGIWFAATKTDESVTGLIPQQGYYRSRASASEKRNPLPVTFYAEY